MCGRESAGKREFKLRAEECWCGRVLVEGVTKKEAYESHGMASTLDRLFLDADAGDCGCAH